MDHTVTVLELLRQRRRASRSDLIELSGLSPATVSRAVSRLRDSGFVTEQAVESAAFGRPPRLVELVADAAFVLAIDAGGSRIRVELADLVGEPAAVSSGTAATPADGDSVIGEIVRLARGVSGRAHGRPILAAAAGISGIVDRATGSVLLSPDLPGLQGLPASNLLADALGGLPVAVDNDDLLAAVGEATAGAAAGARDVVFLSLGFGLGAGIIVGGRPLRGAGAAAGAIAYLEPGRLEERASGRAIPLRYRALAPARRAGADLDAGMVFARAAAGDAVAVRVVGEAMDALGELVVNVAAVLDPEVIVLGGGLTRNGPALLEHLAARLARSVPYPPRIVLTALGDGAVARGASVLALTLARQQLATRFGSPSTQPEPARVGVLELV
jgi:predicted NBD/HSP70 family sugar kinase